MAAYYFDSSALVKRYAEEVGSPWVGSLESIRKPENEAQVAYTFLAHPITGGKLRLLRPRWKHYGIRPKSCGV